MAAHITDNISIASAQLNPIVGDLNGNLKKARDALARARQLGADLLVFSELFITGYPPEDLVLKPAFQNAAMAAVKDLANGMQDGDPAMLMGTIWREDGKLFNSVAFIEDGAIKALRHKVKLPNYGVFDEHRIFDEGPMPGPINFRGIRIGVPICEDIWVDDVVECLEETGAEFFITPNGSPYTRTKAEQRMNVVVARVTESDRPLLYVNQVGGQDELVFDGGSFALNSDRSLGLQMPRFKEDIAISYWSREASGWRVKGDIEKSHDIADGDNNLADNYMAAVLGLRDYVQKNGFPGVVLGLSGGIDSALTAAIVVDALGADKLHCVMLPYRYTSDESLKDASDCAQALGVRYDIIDIEKPVNGFNAALSKLFKACDADTTEENIQSRARGTILMAISNKFGSMVVTTGNKSEVSVGYATLYGDMNGGFNPIKDIYKMEVYALSRWRNASKPDGCLGPDGIVIPKNIITKAPTAELRENQTDQDSLPPYEILDDILSGLVEEERSVDEIIAKGHDRDTVERIQHLLYLSEYKRRQAAPGVKISTRNFGRDRRYPITNKFRETSSGKKEQ